jgi:hypothetical protein
MGAPVTSAQPADARPEPVCAIVAPVRGEAPFLIEWIAYHRVRGVHRFLLADNGGDDGTSELLERLDRHGLVKRFDWRGRRYFQLEFYQHIIRELANSHRLVLIFVDVDEFLRSPPQAPNIPRLARWLFADESVSAVALNWALYGSSGHVSAAPGLVLERFRRRGRRDHPIHRHVKTMVRADRCAGPGSNPHAFALTGGRYVTSLRDDVEWDKTSEPEGLTKTVIWNRIRIDHFVVKSREEFERKRARGSAARPLTEELRGRDSYFSSHDRNEVEDPMPLDLVEQTKAEMDRILRVLPNEPGVGPAET